nr:MAG TPA: hypothetical protein [Caudoviricetes sp.]
MFSAGKRNTAKHQYHLFFKIFTTKYRRTHDL